MSPGATPPSRALWWRTALIGLGAACLLAVLLPPVVGLARTHEWVDTLQYGVLAVVVPPLVVLGAPWRWSGTLERVVGSVAASRRGVQTVAVLAVEVVALVAWRLPPVVGAVERAHWLVALEAVTLLGAGTALWAVLVDTPPFVGREPALHRLVLATIPMWTVWIVAYVEDMAGVTLAGFHHVAGHGLSASADREVATVVAFFVGACAFLPVVFFNLMAWLRSEDRPVAWRHALARDATVGAAGGVSASGPPPTGVPPG